jgi:hypothetical protein
MITTLFTVQVTARPENMGDGNNERYAAQAFATNGSPLSYRGEGPTLAAAFRQFVRTVDEHEHAPGKKH